ncbi:hypothetical protein NU195Hw_Modified_403t1 [Hortaea werneckii]
MVDQNAPATPQTHYFEPFGRGWTTVLITACALLAIVALIGALLDSSGKSVAAAVLTQLAIGPAGFLLIIFSDPSVGWIQRQSLDIPEGPSDKVTTDRPFFGRKKMERTGGCVLSRFHGQLVDYDEPFVVYNVFGYSFRIRWGPALLVVDW